MSEEIQPGSRVFITGEHPWSGCSGEAIAFEHYGPALFRRKGWRVKLDESLNVPYGQECYVKPEQLRLERRKAAR